MIALIAIYMLTFLGILIFNYWALKKCRGNYRYLLKTKESRISFFFSCLNMVIGWYLFQEIIAQKTEIGDPWDGILPFAISLTMGCALILALRCFNTYKIKKRKKVERSNC